MNRHLEDDEIYEAGGEMPTSGKPLDPEEVARVFRLPRRSQTEPAHEEEVPPWPSDDDYFGGRPDNDNAHQQSHDHDASASKGNGFDQTLESRWRTLAEWGALSAQPPPRKWLITRADDETNGTTAPVGVLPLGKVGLLIGAGGTGKTLASSSLALAVATGRSWLNYFGVANPGRVLLALGEEDPEEVWRRCYAVAQAMSLTPQQRAQAAANIVALPLAGIPVALVESAGSKTTASEVLHSLGERLRATEWRLIILDPLSRFAGADTEKDNAAATRFIQAVESLVSVPGSPAVLIVHHTNKLSRSEGSKASTSNARGSSAITDGGRWVAELESHGDDGARLTVTKSNYSPCGMPVELVRDRVHNGYLRAATSEELKQRGAAHDAERDEAKEVHLKELGERVIAALSASPGLSKTLLKGVVAGRGQDVGLVVERLVRAGRVRPSASKLHGFEVVGGAE